MGERSSWLTSEANRASRSMRSCTASAMSLNELTSRSRSGSRSGSRRVSRPPDGQIAGRVGHAGDRAEQASAGRPPDGRREHRGRRAAEDERTADHAEAAGEGRQREHLEVLDVELGDVDADGQVGLTVEDETLSARVTVDHVADERPREMGEVELSVGCVEPAVVAVEVVEAGAAAVRPDLAHHLVGRRQAAPQQVPDEAGVEERLLDGDLVALAGELPAGQRVGQDGEARWPGAGRRGRTGR